VWVATVVAKRWAGRDIAEAKLALIIFTPTVDIALEHQCAGEIILVSIQ
jgi:hypothetical protein